MTRVGMVINHVTSQLITTTTATIFTYTVSQKNGTLFVFAIT